MSDTYELKFWIAMSALSLACLGCVFAIAVVSYRWGKRAGRVAENNRWLDDLVHRGYSLAEKEEGAR